MPTESKNRNHYIHKVLPEAFTAFRFAFVGALATVVHIGILAFLLSNTTLPVLLGNTVAFIILFVPCFVAHYFWTFQIPGNQRKAMFRFLVISVSGFFFNMVVLTMLLQIGWVSPFVAAIGSTFVVPLISFLANRLWGFQKDSNQIV